MTGLRIELSEASKAQIAAACRLLAELPKDAAKLLCDQLLGLLDGAGLDVAIPAGVAAPVASNGVVCLRIDGLRELIAAARDAN